MKTCKRKYFDERQEPPMDASDKLILWGCVIAFVTVFGLVLLGVVK